MRMTVSYRDGRPSVPIEVQDTPSAWCIMRGLRTMHGGIILTGVAVRMADSTTFSANVPPKKMVIPKLEERKYIATLTDATGGVKNVYFDCEATGIAIFEALNFKHYIREFTPERVMAFKSKWKID
jgi:hypothetical protein